MRNVENGVKEKLKRTEWNKVMECGTVEVGEKWSRIAEKEGRF